MQDSDYNRLKSELISIGFIDIDCKEINYPLDFLADNTLTFANLQITTCDNQKTCIKRASFRAELRKRLETEKLYVRYLKVGNTNTNETYNCIDNYGGSQLKLDLKGRYNLKSEDVSQLKIIQEQLADICFVADKLLEFYKRDYLRMRDESYIMDKECNIDRWGELMTRFGISNGGKSRSVSTIRTMAICDFGTNTYLSEKLLKDIGSLFGKKKSVLALIIKDLEPKNTNTGKPQEPPKGYYLGLSEPQLETLHRKLIDGIFLDRNTKLEHFKNAFNGEVLAEGFKQLKWLENKSVLSLFVGLINHKNKWKIAESVFENCDSGNLRKTFDRCDGLDTHKSNIKLFRNILP